MATYTLPKSNPPCPVHLPNDLTQEELESFPAFKTWKSTLARSLSLQKSDTHEFHAHPYRLRKIDVQSVDYFGGKRLGFVKLKAEITNDSGETLPGSVFLRGGSVAMLLVLQPDDAPQSSERDKFVIMTVQPRIPAGSLSFSEIPAGMVDDGTFIGGAAKEIKEETGLTVPEDELINMTSLALTQQGAKNRSQGEMLQEAIYPSPGSSDEFIPIFLWQKRMERTKIEELQGKLTGEREASEKIVLKMVRLENLWREGARDGKTLAAWAMYEGLRREGRLSRI